MSIEAMRQALEALQGGYGDTKSWHKAIESAIKALRTAIQQAEQPATPESVYQIRKAFTQDAEWAWHDATEEAFHMHPEKHRRILYTHPAPSVPKDDQIAALVNKVRDIAHMFHDHQSLRERIAIELVPALKVTQEVKSDAERGRLLIEWLKRYGLLHAEFGQIGAGEKPENWWLLHAPWGIDQTRPFLGHGKTPEQAIDAMLATK